MFDYTTLGLTGYAPRGIRNNNPGNLEHSANNAWKGLADREQMTDEQAAESRFCVFTDPRYGIRAIAKLMQSYQKRYKLRSIAEIFQRYAPRQDNNDTRAYADAVAKAVGVSVNETISVRDYETIKKMVTAIIQHENGIQPYPVDLIEDGIAMAGIDTPGESSDAVKPAANSRETIAAGAGVAGASGLVLTKVIESVGVQPEVASVLSDAVQNGIEKASQINDLMTWISLIQLGLTVVVAFAALDWLLNRRLSSRLGLR